MNGCTQHTPGPWVASQAAGNWYSRRWCISSTHYGTNPNVTDGRNAIADVMGNTEDQARANAALIAAAPDLLAALQDAAVLLDEYHAYSDAMCQIGRGFSEGRPIGAAGHTALGIIGNAHAAIDRTTARQ